MPLSSGDKDAGPSSHLSNVKGLKAIATTESAKHNAELFARFVVVPPGDDSRGKARHMSDL